MNQEQMKERTEKSVNVAFQPLERHSLQFREPMVMFREHQLLFSQKATVGILSNISVELGDSAYVAIDYDENSCALSFVFSKQHFPNSLLFSMQKSGVLYRMSARKIYANTNLIDRIILLKRNHFPLVRSSRQESEPENSIEYIAYIQ